jgi:hypothetical protein
VIPWATGILEIDDLRYLSGLVGYRKNGTLSLKYSLRSEINIKVWISHIHIDLLHEENFVLRRDSGLNFDIKRRNLKTEENIKAFSI